MRPMGGEQVREAVEHCLAVLGAVAFTLLKELLSTYALVGPLADHWQLSLGLVIIAFVAWLPRGLIGLVQRISPEGSR